MDFEKKMPTMNFVNTQQDKGVEDIKKEDDDLKKNETEDSMEKIEQTEDATKNEGDSKIIEDLKLKNEELEKKLLYLAAEYENSKKRSKIEIDNANKFAISKFAVDAVNIYDILQTAVQNVEPNDVDKVLYDGVKMTLGEFDKMFERIQINKIEPEVGNVFDHNKHEAISRVQSELEAGCIVKVVRPGYELYGRLLRPAMVIVSGGN